MARFVYWGIPIMEGGEVVAVQPVDSIVAADGKHYRGVLAQDERGNAFVYNQYPDTGVEPITWYRLLDSEGFALVDSEGYALFVRR